MRTEPHYDNPLGAIRGDFISFILRRVASWLDDVVIPASAALNLYLYKPHKPAITGFPAPYPCRISSGYAADASVRDVPRTVFRGSQTKEDHWTH